jgi:hypothetical protein
MYFTAQVKRRDPSPRFVALSGGIPLLLPLTSKMISLAERMNRMDAVWLPEWR